MTGYRLHEVLLSIAACAVIVATLSVRGCQQAEALRIERVELDRFHRELMAAYGVTPDGGGAAGEDWNPPAPDGFRLIPAAPGEAGTLLVDLNRADQRVLEGLPGIGPNTAEAIIATRERTGRFLSVDDLLRVPGIAEKTVDRLRPNAWAGGPDQVPPPPASPAAPPRPLVPPMTEPFTAETPHQPLPGAPPTPAPTATPQPTPVVPLYRPEEAHRQFLQQRARNSGRPASGDIVVNLNTATIGELETLEGIGTTKALAIIQHRNAYGPFRAVEDLVNVKGIGEILLTRNRHRLRVN
jgi:competence protein ComEA